jgi:hypothetical protein
MGLLKSLAILTLTSCVESILDRIIAWDNKNTTKEDNNG